MNNKNELSKTHRLLGLRIRRLRQERGMTQEDLAFKIGVDRSYMGFVERGERNPTLDKIDKIARVLKVKLNILFKGI